MREFTIKQGENGWLVYVDIKDVTNIEVAQRYNGRYYVFSTIEDCLDFIAEVHNV